MTIFVTGGCKNGKSTFALKCALQLSGDGPRYYIATMEPSDDDEWERIRIHRAARAGLGFVTLEQGRNLRACLNHTGRRGTFLLDSVTACWQMKCFREAIRRTEPRRNGSQRIWKG